MVRILHELDSPHNSTGAAMNEVRQAFGKVVDWGVLQLVHVVEGNFKPHRDTFSKILDKLFDVVLPSDPAIEAAHEQSDAYKEQL